VAREGVHRSRWSHGGTTGGATPRAVELGALFIASADDFRRDAATTKILAVHQAREAFGAAEFFRASLSHGFPHLGGFPLTLRGGSDAGRV
jgi:hypothetical protein